jgi:methyltransferase, FkbM family
MAPEAAGKFGTLRGDLSFFKDRVDFWLTRFPGFYLAVEARREWVNWDKRVYLSFIRRGDVVLDIGANVGAHSVFFSHLAGRSGRVVSFEPLRVNLDSLRSLLARRGRYENVDVVEAAVGNPDSGTHTATIRVPGADFTQASLAAQSAGSWHGQVEVRSVECPITSVDRCPVVRALPNVSFVKLDVEGAELLALKGAAATIARHRPLIYCEVYRKWTEAFGYGPSELMDLAGTLGYREARVIVDGKIRAHVVGAPIPDTWFTSSSDVLFFREEHRHLVQQFDARYLGRSQVISR